MLVPDVFLIAGLRRRVPREGAVFSGGDQGACLSARSPSV